MLCRACDDLVNDKSTRWKGFCRATVESGEGSGQLTSTDSTPLDPDADPNDDADADSDSSELPCSFDPTRRAGGFVHHLSGRAFLAAAQQGCQLCRLLVSQLSPDQRLELSREPENVHASSADYDHVVVCGFVGGYRVPGEWGYGGCYSPRTLHLQSDPIWFRVQFFPSKIQEPLPDPDISYPNAVGCGEASVSLVRRWIAACEEHEDCRSRSLADVYKTQGRPRFARIVDVQDGSSDPRLADVDEIPAGAIYMTLSHCWGDPEHKPLLLTLNALVAFKTGIPWSKLPKTFADAIVFTRNMGIRYIWIDSLCIIQDCADDWARQSAVMCEVYSASYLNLAATGAADSRGGLFAERDGQLIQPLRLTQPPSLGKYSSVKGAIRYYDALDEEEWEKEVEDEPLCQRGWIIQERALARRSLHFGRRQLYWECTSTQASESVPLGYPDMYGDFKKLDPLLPDRVSTGAALVETWERLVEAYTRAVLTKESDRLVAISGLAKALAAQSGISYISGMWDYGLEDQLIWYVHSASKRPDVFRAPSWSWASTNSQICIDDWRRAHAITVLSVGVESASPSGNLPTCKSCPITIRGVLIPGILPVVAERMGAYLRVLIARKTPIDTTGAHQSPWKITFRPDSDSEQDNRGAVLLLPTELSTSLSTSHRGGLLCTADVEGIVLKTAAVKGTLRRIGTFSMDGSIPRRHPLRKLWLMDDTGTTSSTRPSNDKVGDCETSPPGNTLDSISSKTDPLEGLSEDLYHHYEEIGDSGDQAEAALKRKGHKFDWTPVFSGGFTFDLV